MLIFNTTYKVSTKVNDRWLNWTKEYYIPFMLESGSFTKAQITKIVGSEDEEGTSYSVQFHIADMDTLMKWHKNNASAFQSSCADAFGNEVSFFSTVLELSD